MSNSDLVQPAPIVQPLLGWYRQSARDLPWRRSRDPYAIWLSETMLQQTQVATVIPYYERFKARFPTIGDLAAAPLDDVLQLWAGLGYYARARHIHAAALEIVAKFGGHVPNNVNDLLTLPGVGRYTAGAVASIAFDRRAAAVDGNVLRVVARLHAIRGDLKAPPVRRRIEAICESMLPEHDCGSFNQALMELGATICSPGNPVCPRCPLLDSCKAKRHGLVDRIPAPAKRAAVRSETHLVAAIRLGGRFLFVQRPATGLWGGLWELPTTVVNGPALRRPPRQSLGRMTAQLFDTAIAFENSPFCRIRRLLTHRDVTFVGYRGTFAEQPKKPGMLSTSARSRWLGLKELDDLPLSSGMTQVVAALQRIYAESVRPHAVGRPTIL